MTDIITSTLNKWQAEYNAGGIPSSVATEPSQSFLDFIAYLRQNHLPIVGAQLIDIGCGRGRNSLYAALQGFEVTAVDLLEHDFGSNIPNLRHFAMDASLPWSLVANSFDAALDAFCFKHFVTEDVRYNYIHELARTLKSQGYYSLALAGLEDGYYRQFLTPHSDIKNLIIDPHNHIASFLYSLEDLLALFSPYFELVYYQQRRSISAMHGHEYPRQIHHCIFKKIA